MKTAHLVIVIAITAVSSAFIGGTISYELLSKRPAEVLRVQSIEIEDSKGQVRGRLGSEKDGAVLLRFMSPNQRPVLSVGSWDRDRP